MYNLVDNMRQVQKGDLSVTIPKDSRDEIGELALNFNFMIKKINELIEEQYKSGQEVKEAELKLVQAEFKTLQAQINPHFLYTTLDLINWMAIKYNCPDIESLIYSLSRFYKLSLRKGADIKVHWERGQRSKSEFRSIFDHRNIKTSFSLETQDEEVELCKIS
ncbi:sensor histidine kinase [Paenibacillus baekrokdamisoli]|uniref:sensor histidine kinase n=1 Tax=Paenibacillus baekrokdamisoli TaxID=1712516 RepID=UPI0022B26C1F|nr:histidine kinase [Paenibacillus baekrokdamisoli]